MIELENITKIYDIGAVKLTELDNLSFYLRDGKIVEEKRR